MNPEQILKEIEILENRIIVLKAYLQVLEEENSQIIVESIIPKLVEEHHENS